MDKLTAYGLDDNFDFESILWLLFILCAFGITLYRKMTGISVPGLIFTWITERCKDCLRTVESLPHNETPGTPGAFPGTVTTENVMNDALPATDNLPTSTTYLPAQPTNVRIVRKILPTYQVPTIEPDDNVEVAAPTNSDAPELTIEDTTPKVPQIPVLEEWGAMRVKAIFQPAPAPNKRKLRPGEKALTISQLRKRLEDERLKSIQQAKEADAKADEQHKTAAQLRADLAKAQKWSKKTRRQRKASEAEFQRLKQELANAESRVHQPEKTADKEISHLQQELTEVKSHVCQSHDASEPQKDQEKGESSAALLLAQDQITQLETAACLSKDAANRELAMVEQEKDIQSNKLRLALEKIEQLEAQERLSEEAAFANVAMTEQEKEKTAEEIRLALEKITTLEEQARVAVKSAKDRAEKLHQENEKHTNRLGEAQARIEELTTRLQQENDTHTERLGEAQASIEELTTELRHAKRPVSPDPRLEALEKEKKVLEDEKAALIAAKDVDRTAMEKLRGELRLSQEEAKAARSAQQSTPVSESNEAHETLKVNFQAVQNELGASQAQILTLSKNLEESQRAVNNWGQKFNGARMHIEKLDGDINNLQNQLEEGTNFSGSQMEAETLRRENAQMKEEGAKLQRELERDKKQLHTLAAENRNGNEAYKKLSDENADLYETIKSGNQQVLGYRSTISRLQNELEQQKRTPRKENSVPASEHHRLIVKVIEYENEIKTLKNSKVGFSEAAVEEFKKKIRIEQMKKDDAVRDLSKANVQMKKLQNEQEELRMFKGLIRVGRHREIIDEINKKHGEELVKKDEGKMDIEMELQSTKQDLQIANARIENLTLTRPAYRSAGGNQRRRAVSIDAPAAETNTEAGKEGERARPVSPVKRTRVQENDLDDLFEGPLPPRMEDA